MDNLTRLAAEALSECFHDILLKSDGFASFEKAAMRAGFESMAAAMSMALERHASTGQNPPRSRRIGEGEKHDRGSAP